jgi:hypothetical protein
MKRREFIAGLGGAAVAWPLVARAQQAAKTYRMGYLSGGTELGDRVRLAGFVRGMRALGYTEGQNLVIASRYADGRFERLPSLVRELLSLNPEVIVVVTTPGNLAANPRPHGDRRAAEARGSGARVVHREAATRRPQPVDRPEAAWRRYGGRASCSQVRGLVLALAHRPDRTRHRARHWSIGI